MFCKNCGQELADGINKCPFCNTPTSEELQTQKYSNNNMNNTNVNGFMAVLVVIIALIIGYVGFRLFFGTLGLMGLDKDTMKSSFKESWDYKFWE